MPQESGAVMRRKELIRAHSLTDDLEARKRIEDFAGSDFAFEDRSDEDIATFHKELFQDPPEFILAAREAVEDMSKMDQFKVLMKDLWDEQMGREAQLGLNIPRNKQEDIKILQDANLLLARTGKPTLQERIAQMPPEWRKGKTVKQMSIEIQEGRGQQGWEIQEEQKEGRQ